MAISKLLDNIGFIALCFLSLSLFSAFPSLPLHSGITEIYTSPKTTFVVMLFLLGLMIPPLMYATIMDISNHNALAGVCAAYTFGVILGAGLYGNAIEDLPRISVFIFHYESTIFAVNHATVILLGSLMSWACIHSGTFLGRTVGLIRACSKSFD